MDILSHLSICFFLLVLLNSPTPTKADLIGDFCHKQFEDQSCITLLESDPRARSASSLLELGGAIVELSSKNALATRGLIQKFRDDGATPPLVQASLSTCDVIYGEILTHLRNAASEFGGRRFEEAARSCSTANGNVRSCQNELRGLDRRPLEVENQNKVMYTLCLLGDRAMTDLKHE